MANVKAKQKATLTAHTLIRRCKRGLVRHTTHGFLNTDKGVQTPAPACSPRGRIILMTNEDCNNNVVRLIRAGSGPCVLLLELLLRNTSTRCVFLPLCMRTHGCHCAGLTNEKPNTTPVMLMQSPEASSYIPTFLYMTGLCVALL